MVTNSTNRISRRDSNRQAAFTFLSNISLGNENPLRPFDLLEENSPIEKKEDHARSPLHSQAAKGKAAQPADRNITSAADRVSSDRGQSILPPEEGKPPPPAHSRSIHSKARSSKATDFLKNISLEAAPSISHTGSPGSKQSRVEQGTSNAASRNKPQARRTQSVNLNENKATSSNQASHANYRSSASMPQLSPGNAPSTSWSQPDKLGIRADSADGSHLGKALRQTKFFLTASANTSIAAISSLGSYRDKSRKNKKRQLPHFHKEYLRQITNIDSLKKRKAESYGYLLVPSNSLGQSEIDQSMLAYDPHYLDDPELKMGSKRPLVGLQAFMGSIIHPNRPADLKRELNDQFRETHAEVDSSITLTKIRTVKSRLLDVGQQLDLEISTVAKAYAYFEKLVLKDVVRKENRKLVAAVCIFLATKVNEPKGFGFGPLLDACEKHLGTAPKDVRAHEFSVFVELGFNLYLPLHEFMPHFERIFTTLGADVHEYLGDRAFYLGDAKA
ncbi:uncharacterized protein VTP21DRAFT_972 [Calcarisporiella thermophila]|uniref:uncharacterized protein n=1 Tax=Calcarisporiella thermophila TaxID=911321 RepID=UPI0037427D57